MFVKCVWFIQYSFISSIEVVNFSNISSFNMLLWNRLRIEIILEKNVIQMLYQRLFDIADKHLGMNETNRFVQHKIGVIYYAEKRLHDSIWFKNQLKRKLIHSNEMMVYFDWDIARAFQYTEPNRVHLRLDIDISGWCFFCRV